MKTKLLAVLLLAGSSLFARSHVFFGIGVGGGYYGTGYSYYVASPPPPPPVYGYIAHIAPRPAIGYTWIPGYYYPVGPRYSWHAGYWARPPYAGAIWVGPRYYGGRYYHGYWRR